MFRKTLVRPDPILRTADRPPVDHAESRFRIGGGEGHHARAAHAAADQMGPIDAELLQQELAVNRVMPPGHRLDATARFAPLAVHRKLLLEALRSEEHTSELQSH